MNHLIAQIRTRNHEKVFKLFSDNNAVFELNTDTLVMVDYEVDHNLDEDAWFRVAQFSQQDYCLAFMRNDFIAAEFNDLRKADFTKIAYIRHSAPDLGINLPIALTQYLQNDLLVSC